MKTTVASCRAHADWDRAKRLVAEAGYKGERIVVIDPADIAQLHAEALVTEQEKTRAQRRASDQRMGHRNQADQR